eukprot:gene51270-35389_t
MSTASGAARPSPSAPPRRGEGIAGAHLTEVGLLPPLLAGYPLRSVADLPLGRAYTVQAVLVPYQRYNRSDGHRPWLPAWHTFTYSSDEDDYGWSPDDAPGRGWGARGGVSMCGTRYSPPSTVEFRSGASVHLRITEQVPPPPPPPPQTAHA